jgi:hypothetical protein
MKTPEFETVMKVAFYRFVYYPPPPRFAGARNRRAPPTVIH